MISKRLGLAAQDGLDLGGSVVVYAPVAGQDLSDIPQARIIQPFRPDHDHFAAQGFHAQTTPDGEAALGVVCLPRSKTEALSLIADAASRCRVVVVDGQNTQGIQSILRAVKARAHLTGTVSKAKGKLFWFDVVNLSDWLTGPALTDGGFWSAPGLFSEAGVDRGSRLLVEALPEKLKGVVADLGAGWGYLSAHILARPDVQRVYVVEAHFTALQCAEHNVTDPRAEFCWADVRDWRAPEPLDAVVMNPPFHIGAVGDPRLGQRFVEVAAAHLKPKGALWMVANRHLPYEDTLAQCFRNVIDLGGDGQFKLVFAEAPLKRR